METDRDTCTYRRWWRRRARSKGGGRNAEDGVLYSRSSDGLVNFCEWNKHLSYGGVLRGHKQTALCLAVTCSLFFSGSADNGIWVWRREIGGAHAYLSVLTGHAGPVKCLAVEDEGGTHEQDEAEETHTGLSIVGAWTSLLRYGESTRTRLMIQFEALVDCLMPIFIPRQI